MRRPLKIVGFALGGVLIAAAIYAYSRFHDYTKPPNAFDTALGIVSFLLCPPSLLSILCIDCEVGTQAGLELFSFIALLNGGFYAALGVIVLRYRKHNTDI
jgi:hypothetical protein